MSAFIAYPRPAADVHPPLLAALARRPAASVTVQDPPPQADVTAAFGAER
jgi:hypothetical protein